MSSTGSFRASQELLKEVFDVAIKEPTIQAEFFLGTKEWRTDRVGLTVFAQYLEVFEDNDEIAFIGPAGNSATPIPILIAANERLSATEIVYFVLGIAIQNYLEVLQG